MFARKGESGKKRVVNEDDDFVLPMMTLRRTRGRIDCEEKKVG